MANSSHMKTQRIARKGAQYWAIAGADTNPAYPGVAVAMLNAGGFNQAGAGVIIGA
jgi:hypothetical protein